MKNIIYILLLFLTFGCAESGKEIFIQEFNWTLEIPKDFTEVPLNIRKKSQEKGTKLIESAYPENEVNIDFKNLFHYNNGKYNSLQAQISELNSEQNFEKEFEQANEIVVNAFAKERPNTKFEQNVGKEIISGLEFKTFDFKTLNDSGENYELKVYSRMFGIKKLEIIVLNNKKEKGKLIENSILNSKFE
ncbi:hypothetical protein [Lacinutrix mariniflava]|uniref:hypothetical protein n=1 Tax=Lacinutrix mariniflava TaxID=342955 RepID=UPI0006E1E13D|nr:hypothetical protein [Lacinutrix mariniflava]